MRPPSDGGLKIYEVDTYTNFKHIFNKDLFTLNKKLELPCCKFHLDLYQKYYLQMWFGAKESHDYAIGKLGMYIVIWVNM